jgi:hypothetical protein
MSNSLIVGIYAIKTIQSSHYSHVMQFCTEFARKRYWKKNMNKKFIQHSFGFGNSLVQQESCQNPTMREKLLKT